MKELPPWNIPSTAPAVHDLESVSSLEMVSKLYGAMQSLITEWNKYSETVNADLSEKDTEVRNAIQEFEHKFTCISNNLVQMVRDNEKKLDGKITDAVHEAVMSGKIVEIYDPMTESLEFRWEVNDNG